jgi:hypothetical protein
MEIAHLIIRLDFHRYDTKVERRVTQQSRSYMS